MTPEDALARNAEADEALAEAKMLPSINYEETLQIMWNKSAAENEVTKYVDALFEATARALSALTTLDEMHAYLAIIHAKAHEYHDQTSEYAATMHAIAAVDKAAGKTK